IEPWGVVEGAKMSEEAQRLSSETLIRRDRGEQSESVRPAGRSVGFVCDIQSGRRVSEILGMVDPGQPRPRDQLSAQGERTCDFQGWPESLLRVVSRRRLRRFRHMGVASSQRRRLLGITRESRAVGLGGDDIYVSARQADGSWGAAEPVTELSSSTNDQRPSIRFDGLELFFFSDRVGGIGLTDLWVSTRGSTSDPWSPPVNLGSGVNSPQDDTQPFIAPD